MNEPTTHSILQRVPAILAVTAASYGLPPHARADRGDARIGLRPARPDTSAVRVLDRARRDAAASLI
jgi:hypothetical protein